MENYQISISWDKKPHHFEVGEYLHQNGESKVKVFQQGKLVASFESDPYNYLHLCNGRLKIRRYRSIFMTLQQHFPKHFPERLSFTAPGRLW